MIQEQRDFNRQRVLKGGKIAFNSGGSTISCTIRNVSEKGALLRVDSVVGIPDVFTLVFATGEESRMCHITRRSANEVGVEFLDRANKGPDARA